MRASSAFRSRPGPNGSASTITRSTSESLPAFPRACEANKITCSGSATLTMAAVIRRSSALSTRVTPVHPDETHWGTHDEYLATHHVATSCRLFPWLVGTGRRESLSPCGWASPSRCVCAAVFRSATAAWPQVAHSRTALVPGQAAKDFCAPGSHTPLHSNGVPAPSAPGHRGSRPDPASARVVPRTVRTHSSLPLGIVVASLAR